MSPELKMSKARAALVLSHPFIATVALTLNLRQDPGCESGWTDGTSIGYSPEWVASLSLEETIFFVAHETFHVVLAHHLRRGGRDPQLWNVAADHVINQMLETARLVVPAGALSDPRFAGMSTEAVYEQLSKGPGAQPPRGMGEVQDATSECGDSLSPAERARLEGELKVRLAQARSQAAALGRLSTAESRAAREGAETTLEWRAMLRQFAATVRTRDDYSWQRPNRRYLAQGLFLPALQNESLGDLVVVIDTSGSVDDRLLGVFQAELDALLIEAPGVTLRVMCCDTVVSSEREMTAADVPLSIELTGGGGTSFCAPFARLEQEGRVPAGLVYFTDLDGEFPRRAPDYPVLWLNYGYLSEPAPFGVTARVDRYR